MKINIKIKSLLQLLFILCIVFVFADEAFAKPLGDVIREEGTGLRKFSEFWLSVANYIFAGGLIALAFGTTFRMDSYSVKKILPNLLVAFVLANASLLLISTAFDISGIVTDIILGSKTGSGIGKDYHNYLVELLKERSAGTGEGDVLSAIFTLITNIFIQLVFIAVYGSLWLFFNLRHWVLQLYAGFAPIAFMSLALPATQGVWKRWSDGFTSWLISKPVAFGMLTLGTIIAGAGADDGLIEGLGGGVFRYIVGVVFMLAALIAPFTVKGIGANLAGQVGGMIKGFGYSKFDSAKGAVASGARSELASMAARGGRLGAFAGGIQATLGKGAIKQQLKAEKERKLTLGEQQAAALRMGQPRIARQKEEQLIGQTKQDLQNIAYKDMNFGDKRQFLAATEINKEQPWNEAGYNQKLAETIANNSTLKKQLGYKENETQDTIAQSLKDGSKQGAAIAAVAGGYNQETGKVTDEVALARIQALQAAKIESGRINEAPILSNDGIILKNNERDGRIVEILENKPQQISKSIMASGGIADKDGNIHPWVAKLAEKGQLNDAVLKGLGDMGNDVAENIGKHLGKLEQHVRNTAKVPDRDVDGNIKRDGVGNTIMTPAISQDFNINSSIIEEDSKQERTLKLLQLASTKGVSAMNQAMIPIPPVSSENVNLASAVQQQVEAINKLVQQRVGTSGPRAEDRSISSGGLVERIQKQAGTESRFGNESRFNQPNTPEQPPNTNA